MNDIPAYIYSCRKIEIELYYVDYNVIVNIPFNFKDLIFESFNTL